MDACALHLSGTEKYGNFRNYYEFNKPEERLKLLPDDLPAFTELNKRKIVALDVGCNSGDLTLCLYQYLVGSGGRDVHILGIDLDDDLIQRARRSNPFPDAVQYMCLDATQPECEPDLRRYLQNFNRSSFDITFCFSVTMWVHLNHGDVGLKKFLEMMSKNTEFLLLEAQTWKCYRNASRRMRRGKKEEFQNLDSLNMNVNVVDNINCYLEGKCDMNIVECFGVTEWRRKVTLHRKQHPFS